MAGSKTTETIEQKEKNPNQSLIDMIVLRVQVIRSEWNTNSDSPRGRELLGVATLLEKAAEALIESGKK